MARTAQKPEFWAAVAVVAEARTGEFTLVEVAAKHGVSVAALKYHFYKGKRAAAKWASTPRVLPVRLKSERSGAVAPSTVYDYVQPFFRKRVYLRETLACRCGHIVTANARDRVGEKTRYVPGFVAHLIVNKCGDSNPQYRREKSCRNIGIPISRSTLCGLIHRGAAELKPLHNAALKLVPASPDVHADETSMRQQDLEGRSYIWSFVTSELVLYLYAPIAADPFRSRCSATRKVGSSSTCTQVTTR